MATLPKTRLDLLVVEKELAPSRERARSLIMAGKIRVNGQPVDKPGRQVSPEDSIECTGKMLPFVSRGGLKLQQALQEFRVDVRERTCLDVGASTGGFTDCLLQNGAAHVFAVDVGYGQLAWKLRTDPRVTVMERTNIRRLDAAEIPSPVDLAVIDVSFISLRIVVPATLKFLKAGAPIVALIKPQFEIGKGRVGKGGVVRKPAHHQEVIDGLSTFFTAAGLAVQGLIPSPVKGPKGNVEFLVYLTVCLA
jgi:23S rRNA (cytidine1920-2'-O)/16S rRNA (cytidine1409-2'-O)-methyltransferase